MYVHTYIQYTVALVQIMFVQYALIHYTTDPVRYVYAVNYIDVKEGAMAHGLTVMLKGGEIHQIWNPTNNGEEVGIPVYT